MNIKQKLNGYAQWIIIIIAVGAIFVNTITLYNDVKHLKADVAEIKQEVKDINKYLLLERDKK